MHSPEPPHAEGEQRRAEGDEQRASCHRPSRIDEVHQAAASRKQPQHRPKICEQGSLVGENGAVNRQTISSRGIVQRSTHVIVGCDAAFFDSD